MVMANARLDFLTPVHPSAFTDKSDDDGTLLGQFLPQPWVERVGSVE